MYEKDGRVCWFDMRAKDVVRTLEVGKEAISSISLKPGNMVTQSSLGI